MKEGIDWDLYVIIDQSLADGRFEDVVKEVISGGARILQLRCKEMKDREFLKVAKKVSEIVKDKGDVNYIINDRVDIALAVDAEGVHLGQDDLPLAISRHLLGDRIIGISTHSLKEALEAESSGATYISVGAIYKTLTKALVKEPVGIDLISRIREKVNLPIIAIGGINERNVDEVIKAGATGVAVCRAILESNNIASATQGLLRKIQEIKRAIERDS